MYPLKPVGEHMVRTQNFPIRYITLETLLRLGRISLKITRLCYVAWSIQCQWMFPRPRVGSHKGR